MLHLARYRNPQLRDEFLGQIRELITEGRYETAMDNINTALSRQAACQDQAKLYRLKADLLDHVNDMPASLNYELG